MKTAIYARVSKTEEGQQNPDNQLQPLRDLARALDCEIVCEYVDRASGGSADRPQFQLMLQDARRRYFDMILVWSLDRFSREGIINTLKYIEQLRMNKVALKSLKESWLDTRDDSMGQLLLAIFSWMADQERRRIQDRTRAGLARVKAQGKKLGRPKGSKDKGSRRRAGYFRRHERERDNKKRGSGIPRSGRT